MYFFFFYLCVALVLHTRKVIKEAELRVVGPGLPAERAVSYPQWRRS